MLWPLSNMTMSPTFSSIKPVANGRHCRAARPASYNRRSTPNSRTR